MRIAAGIVGILVGISSLSYIGLFGGLLGSATSWLGSGPWSHGDSSVNNLGQMISLLSYLSGLLAIVGGIVALSNTRVGGIILAASAFSHWYLLGFGIIGKVFILPIGAAAAFAFFAARSGLQAMPQVSSASAPNQAPSSASSVAASFDRAKWNALVQYDKDIAAIAERLKGLGPKWTDEFASSYLALNDKSYLPEIEKKVVLAAKAEAEQSEQLRAAAQERRIVALEEQQRAAEARRKHVELWKDRLFGTKRRMVLTVAGSLILVTVATVALWPRIPKLVIHTADGALIKVRDFTQGQSEWKCMTTNIPSTYDCQYPPWYQGTTRPFSLSIQVNFSGSERSAEPKIYIGLWQKPLNSARTDAEAALRRFFPLPDSTLCGVVASVEAVRANPAQEVGLSFCPGSKQLTQ